MFAHSKHHRRTHTFMCGFCGKIDSNWIHIHLFAATSIWHFYTLNVYLEIVLFEDGLHTLALGNAQMKFLKNRARCIYEVYGRDSLNVVRVASNIIRISWKYFPVYSQVQCMCLCSSSAADILLHIIRSRWSEAHMLGEDRKELQTFCIIGIATIYYFRKHIPHLYGLE